MIAFSRVASIAPGQTASALNLAKEVAAYAKSAVGVDIKISMPIGGNPNRIRWATQYENLAALEVVANKLLNDAKYMELIGKTKDVVIPGSVFDEIWREL